jgi:hypothetical protein
LSHDAWVAVGADVLMPAGPLIALGLAGPELVQDDVDLAVAVIGDHLVHEVEELNPSPAFAVFSLDLASGDVEGGEQGGRAPALVFGGKAGQCPGRWAA